MLQRSVVVRASPALPASLRALVAAYPRRGGEFLGNTIAGHNAFIHDIPQTYSKQHARHFALVEALTVTPLFALSMVHYFSIFCQHPGRVRVLMPLMRELAEKATVQHRWLELVESQTPVTAVVWRVGMLLLQLTLFPLWLLVSATAPQLVHATAQHVNHILYNKYDAISSNAPPFVAESATRCLQAQDFHEQQTRLSTDVGVAIIMLLLIFYLTS